MRAEALTEKSFWNLKFKEYLTADKFLIADCADFIDFN